MDGLERGMKQLKLEVLAELAVVPEVQLCLHGMDFPVLATQAMHLLVVREHLLMAEMAEIAIRLVREHLEEVAPVVNTVQEVAVDIRVEVLTQDMHPVAEAVHSIPELIK
jgi:hypothetical protein